MLNKLEAQIKKVAQTAVKQAGDELLKRYLKYKREDAKFKSSHEIVTAADLAAEKIITDAIKKNFPTHNILAEESGDNKKISDYEWVIDPLDGTHNFSMHNPLWTVAVGIFYKGESLMSFIYAPFLQEFFMAVKGQGAYLNNKKIKVSKIASGKVINTYCHGSQVSDAKKAIAYYAYQKLNGFDIRQLGSASIELAYVAVGRVESIAIPGVKTWDAAAGVLLVREAGGLATDFKNKDWSLKSNDLVASNRLVHKQILGVLKKI